MNQVARDALMGRGLWRSLVGVAAALILAATAGAAPAGPQKRGSLVVRGTSSGMAEVTFPTRVRLHRPDVEALFNSTVRTGGRFTGFWLLGPGSNRRVAGLFYYRYDIFQRQGWRPPPITMGLPLDIPAGTYKVAFFTESDATITLPLSSLSETIIVTPAPGSMLPVQHSQVNPQTVAGGPIGTATIPVHFGRNDFAALGVAEEGTAVTGGGPMTNYKELCLARPGEQKCVPLGDRCLSDPGLYGCLNQWRGPWGSSGHSIGGSGGSSSNVFYYQGSFQKIPPGEYEPYFRVISGRSNVKMEAFALNVDLPPFDKSAQPGGARRSVE